MSIISDIWSVGKGLISPPPLCWTSTSFWDGAAPSPSLFFWDNGATSPSLFFLGWCDLAVADLLGWSALAVAFLLGRSDLAVADDALRKGRAQACWRRQRREVSALGCAGCSTRDAEASRTVGVTIVSAAACDAAVHLKKPLLLPPPHPFPPPTPPPPPPLLFLLRPAPLLLASPSPHLPLPKVRPDPQGWPRGLQDPRGALIGEPKAAGYEPRDVR